MTDTVQQSLQSQGSSSCPDLRTPTLGSHTTDDGMLWAHEAHDSDSFEDSTCQCGICLGTSSEEAHQLKCRHSFCQPCLNRHVYTILIRGQRQPWCPTCRQNLAEDDISKYCQQALTDAQALLDEAGAQVEEPPEPEGWWRQALQRYRYKRAAQRAHLKICPSCRAPIEKNLGCNHMTCPCGQHFDWRDAETVAPCHRLHRGRNNPLWGSTCPGCTPIAKAKLGAWRTTVVIGAVPVGVAAGALALAASPFYLACKVVQRRRRIKRADGLRSLRYSDVPSWVTIDDDVDAISNLSFDSESFDSIDAVVERHRAVVERRMDLESLLSRNGDRPTIPHYPRRERRLQRSMSF